VCAYFKNLSMKKNILLVEDDELDVKSINKTLKNLKVDYDLHVVNNGVDAIVKLTSNVGSSKFLPDIILLDINMPRMNGIEFLTIIKNYYRFKNIKIFILANSIEEYDKLSLQNLGVYGCILKPMDFKKKSSRYAIELLNDILEN